MKFKSWLFKEVEEKEFLQALKTEPTNWHLKLVYADWLEEQGNPLGEAVRLVYEILQTKKEQKPPYGEIPLPTVGNITPSYDDDDVKLLQRNISDWNNYLQNTNLYDKIKRLSRILSSIRGEGRKHFSEIISSTFKYSLRSFLEHLYNLMNKTIDMESIIDATPELDHSAGYEEVIDNFHDAYKDISKLHKALR